MCYESEILTVDKIFNEFQQKYKEAFLVDINSTTSTLKKSNEYLKKENIRLSKELSSLDKKLQEAMKNTEESILMTTIINNIKTTTNDAVNKDKRIYNFLELVFQKDYEEEVYNVPLWIGALTQYYSNKNTVIKILRLFDIKLPDGIENFRLPVDWNEDELDMFFDTVYNHVNCNGCVFEGNLRFWGTRSLEDVKTQCYSEFYSEIPWQYVLRNPLLKNKKYLEKIGKNAFKSSNWEKFYEIDKYLDLSDTEIKTILNNIDYTKLSSKGLISNFVMRNLRLIKNDEFLEKVYSLFYKSYDFNYNKKILEMPYKYVLRWAYDLKDVAVHFIENNKECFTEEQRREFLMKALEL